jgi:hypothetical protein
MFRIILAYLWVMMTLLGALVKETFMVYPNVFHDPLGRSKSAWSSCPLGLRATSSRPSGSSPG